MRKISLYKATCALLCAISITLTGAHPSYAIENNMKIVDEEKLEFKADLSQADESNHKIKTTITFESYNAEDNGFNDETETIKIGETEFKLSDISNLEMIDSRTPKRRKLNVESEIFIKGTESSFLPDETLVKDGVTWKLTSKTLVDREIEDEVKEVIEAKRYNGVEQGVPIPGSMDYTYTDENTGESVTGEIFLSEQSEIAQYWTDFTFPISISGYDADVFDLNGVEINASEPLIEHADLFLDMLGLDESHYKINSIEWDGEEYEKGGAICRDAIAIGEKSVTDVDAVYSGTITLPHKDGSAWECIYTEELDEGKSAIYKFNADAVYVSTAVQTPLGKIIGLITAAYEAVINAIKEHPFLASTQLILIASAITFVIARKKKRCRYDHERICDYQFNCDKCPYYQLLSEEEPD